MYLLHFMPGRAEDTITGIAKRNGLTILFFNKPLVTY